MNPASAMTLAGYIALAVTVLLALLWALGMRAYLTRGRKEKDAYALRGVTEMMMTLAFFAVLNIGLPALFSGMAASSRDTSPLDATYHGIGGLGAVIACLLVTFIPARLTARALARKLPPSLESESGAGYNAHREPDTHTADDTNKGEADAQ